jgi:hypothetical protein
MTIQSNFTFCFPYLTKSVYDPEMKKWLSDLFPRVRLHFDGGLNKNGKIHSAFLTADPSTLEDLLFHKQVKKAYDNLEAGLPAKITYPGGYCLIAFSKVKHHQHKRAEVIDGWDGIEFYETYRRRMLEQATNPTPPAEESAASAEAEPEVRFGDDA